MLHQVLIFQTFLSRGLQTAVSLLKVLVFSRWPKPLPVATNKVCSLLGNGPSLKETLETNLDFLKKTEVFCVNNFVSSPFFEVLKPQNYVLHDPGFYMYDGLTFTHEAIGATLNGLRERTTWPMNLYVQQKAKKSAYITNITRQNPNIRLVYYNYTIFYGYSWLKHWFFKKNLAMPQAQNVLVTALFLALNRKFVQVFLFGADHSWHEQLRLGSQGLEVKDHHFYDKKEANYIPIFDFARKEHSTMRKQFESLAKAFAGYEVLREYAQYRGVEVLNASAKTYVDAFPVVKV